MGIPYCICCWYSYRPQVQHTHLHVPQALRLRWCFCFKISAPGLVWNLILIWKCFCTHFHISIAKFPLTFKEIFGKIKFGPVAMHSSLKLEALDPWRLDQLPVIGGLFNHVQDCYLTRGLFASAGAPMRALLTLFFGSPWPSMFFGNEICLVLFVYQKRKWKWKRKRKENKNNNSYGSQEIRGVT